MSLNITVVFTILFFRIFYKDFTVADILIRISLKLDVICMSKYHVQNLNYVCWLTAIFIVLFCR